MNNFKNNNQGIAAIFSVVVIGVVVLLLSRASATIGQTDLSIVNNQIHASQASSNANVCLYDALRMIDMDYSHDGGTSLELNNGACQVTVATSSEEYLIEAEGHVRNYTKKINGVAEIIDGQVVLKDWEEQ